MTFNEMEIFFLANPLYFSIIIAALIERLKETSKCNIVSVWAVFLLGTFFHELAHFLVSLFTFGQPVSFNILPKRSKDNNTIILGSVKSQNTR